MHVTNGSDALQQVRSGFGVRLVKHALVADARCARLVRVNAGDENELIGNKRGQGAQPTYVFAYGIFVISRTGADNHDKLVGFAREYITNLGITTRFESDKLVRKRIFRLELRRLGQNPVDFHSHLFVLSSKRQAPCRT